MSLLSEKFRHFRNKYINALILVLKIEKKKRCGFADGRRCCSFFGEVQKRSSTKWTLVTCMLA